MNRHWRANVDVRQALLLANIMQWEVAMRLGVSEATMTRKLRTELSDTEKKVMFEAIEKIKAEREG